MWSAVIIIKVANNEVPDHRHTEWPKEGFGLNSDRDALPDFPETPQVLPTKMSSLFSILQWPAELEASLNSEHVMCMCQRAPPRGYHQNKKGKIIKWKALICRLTDQNLSLNRSNQLMDVKTKTETATRNKTRKQMKHTSWVIYPSTPFLVHPTFQKPNGVNTKDPQHLTNKQQKNPSGVAAGQQSPAQIPLLHCRLRWALKGWGQVSLPDNQQPLSWNEKRRDRKHRNTRRHNKKKSLRDQELKRLVFHSQCVTESHPSPLPCLKRQYYNFTTQNHTKTEILIRNATAMLFLFLKCDLYAHVVMKHLK